MTVHFSDSDLSRIEDAVNIVISQKLQNIKCTVEIPLDGIVAKVYHMGTNNPVIRIDLKMEV